MIIDLNATIGHYPFRALQATTAAGVIEIMDAHGIDRAVVSSLHAVFYRDAHRGNVELRAEIAPFGARFIPVATVNPMYPGWERDLKQAVGEWGMKAVTLVPDFHGYTLADEFGRAALEQIEALDVPVLLTQRFEDRRQRHAWDKADDMSFAAVIAAAKAHPRLRFILSNWAGLDGAAMAAAGLRGRCLVDFARLQVVLRKEALRLIDNLGGECLAFGSHLPFDYAGGSLVKLANVERFRPAEVDKVASGNVMRFLRLER